MEKEDCIRVRLLLASLRFMNILGFNFTEFQISASVKATEYKNSPNTWNTKYFIPVCCFVLFNVGDWLGRFFAEYIQWPKPGRMGMIVVFILSVSRVAFIPLFLHCHIPPEERIYTRYGF